MRATIRDLLVTEPSLTALIPTERWFSIGAVQDVPKLPFATLRWIAPVQSTSQLHQLQVAVYDHRTSYKLIDRILGGPYRTGGVYAVLSNIADLVGADGRVTQADYLGDSGDQEDVDFKASMKYSSWQIVGRITG